MIKVSSKVMESYNAGDTRLLSVYIYKGEGIEIPPEKIYSESFRLEEKLSAQESIEFIGCISSFMSVTIRGIYENITGKRIKVSICTENTQNKPITLFNGIIDSAKNASNKKSMEIKAYDELYTASETDVGAWFYELSNRINQEGTTITIRDFRFLLFEKLRMETKVQTLPNDNYVIHKLAETMTLEEGEEYPVIKAGDLIKDICQINGMFGIINREGVFEYRELGKTSTDDGAYPSATLYPPFFLGVGDIEEASESQYYGKYRSCNYESYKVNGIQRVYVKQQAESHAGWYGDEFMYRYMVQGNHLTLKSSMAERKTLAKNIHGKVAGHTYNPFELQCEGLPWVEVGDIIEIYVYDFKKSTEEKDAYKLEMFTVLERTLEGIQAMKDTLSAQGAEGQKEFISDGGYTENIPTSQVNEKVDNLDDRLYGDGGDIEQLQQSVAGMWHVESVPSLPPKYEVNTIYFIQGSAG